VRRRRTLSPRCCATRRVPAGRRRRPSPIAYTPSAWWRRRRGPARAAGPRRGADAHAREKLPRLGPGAGTGGMRTATWRGALELEPGAPPVRARAARVPSLRWRTSAGDDAGVARSRSLFRRGSARPRAALNAAGAHPAPLPGQVRRGAGSRRVGRRPAGRRWRRTRPPRTRSARLWRRCRLRPKDQSAEMIELPSPRPALDGGAAPAGAAGRTRNAPEDRVFEVLEEMSSRCDAWGSGDAARNGLPARAGRARAPPGRRRGSGTPAGERAALLRRQGRAAPGSRGAGPRIEIKTTFRAARKAGTCAARWAANPVIFDNPVHLNPVPPGRSRLDGVAAPSRRSWSGRRRASEPPNRARVALQRADRPDAAGDDRGGWSADVKRGWRRSPATSRRCG